MADRDYTPYQRKVIQRYYRNQDAMGAQRLQEIVTDLYLATTDKKKETLWARALELLGKAGATPAEIREVSASRDVEALAKVVARLAKA